MRPWLAAAVPAQPWLPADTWARLSSRVKVSLPGGKAARGMAQR